MPELLEWLRAALADRYDVLSEIGRGGMATVFRAEDRKHHRIVAIKVLHPELTVAVGAERFLHEISIVAGLTHPHILPLHDSGQADGLLYYVMPYIDGESLRRRLQREGRLSLEEALRLAREVAEGLGHAHDHGVVHRDIKPGNILLEEGHAVIADFGVARAIEQGGGEKLTETGLVVGTPAYMSPEQVAGDGSVDGRSDLYSLACVLFEMVSGDPPFTGPSRQAVLTRQLVDSAPDIRTSRPDAPAELQGILRTALHKTPDARFQSAGEMGAALSSVRSTVDSAVSAKLRREFVRRARGLRDWRRVAALALVVLVAASIPFLMRELFRPAEPLGAAVDPRRSYAAVAFGRSAQTAREERIAMQAADYLAFLLDGWAKVDAALDHELMGRRLELGLPVASLPTLDDGLLLARAVKVGTLIGVRVRVVSDTAHLEVRLYDVEGGQALGPSRQLQGPVDALETLVEDVAGEILELRGEDPSSLKRESTVQEAWQELLAGRSALYDWNLTEAERRFRSALAHDPDFARANHYLAVTLFWRMRGESESLFDPGPEIQRLTSDAMRLADGPNLNPRLADHIAGFHAFATGDYEAARSRYDALIQRDSTDTEAWLFRGVVEWEDPWLEATGAGLVPRGDINLARRSFRTSTRLWPEFQVSRGLEFEIADRLTYLLLNPLCEGFSYPDGSSLSPFEDSFDIPGEGFFPQLIEDSISWIPCADFDRALWQAGAYVQMAETLYEESLKDIETWARFAPDQPRPQEEWAAMLLRWQSRQACDSDTALALELTREALEHTEIALGLRSDTTPSSRIRLAMLRLAAGRIDALQAVAMVEAGLREAESAGEGQGPAHSLTAANAFLAVGRPGRAIELLHAAWIPERRGARDPADGTMYDHGDVFDALQEIRLLGAVGATGERLAGAVEAVGRVWSEPDFSPRARSVLQWSVSLNERDPGADIRPALAQDAAMRRVWFSGWGDDLDEKMTPVWRGLVALDAEPERAAEWLEPALERLEHMQRPYPTEYFITAVLAQSLGEHETAEDLLRKAAECPLHVRALDVGWGLSPLSRLYRARSLTALGRAAEARSEYAAVAKEWAEADAECAELAMEARRGAGPGTGAP
jgi:tetratricopeptide (TPR) repeat protein